MPDAPLTEANKQSLVDSFHDQHRQDYGHAFEEQEVEVITLRVVAVVEMEPLSWPALEAGEGRNPKSALLYTRPTTFEAGERHDTPRYDRAKLRAGQSIDGPAIVVQHDSTTLIPPGFEASVSGYGNLHVRA